MTRKLAHIEEIVAINPIKGADNIEVATVLGWQCVVNKRDGFKVGDRVVYIEVDSVLPAKPEFEFLKDRNYRIRTIKLKGQVSQGLVLPISILEDFGRSDMRYIGEDVTGWLEVTKYLSKSELEEIEIHDDKKGKGKLFHFLLRYKWFRDTVSSKKKDRGFPYWVKKTDEERIQNIPQILEQFSDCDVYITEKVDYQSVTFTGKLVPKFSGILSKLPFKKYLFVVCSRNLTTNDKNSLYWKIAEKYKIERILKENPTLTIQGEQGNTKVQGNKYGISDPILWVFNIIDHERNYHFDYTEMKAFCKKYELNLVPFLINCKLSELGTTVQELVEKSKGKSHLNPNVEREGIVVRCIEEGSKILSFKVINPNFLLKYNE